MQASDRYRLKLKIDESLLQYGVSAVAWVTQWSELRIVKYDHPYSSDRSVVAEWLIKDEADWNEQRSQIEQELQMVGMEQAILEAASQNADDLQKLLASAGEKMDAEQYNRLLDKVLQVMDEGLRDIRGWNEEVEGME